MIRAPRVLMCAGLLMLAGVVTYAQDPVTAAPQPQPRQQQQPGRRGGGAGRQGLQAVPDVTANMTPNEVDRLFDAYELFQAQGALQLDNATFLSFGTRFQRLQNVRRLHQKARQTQIAELRILLKPETAADPATLAAKTKALDDIEAGEAGEIQKSLADVDQVLTVVQRARLRMFMFNMEQMKLNLIAQARQAARGGGPGDVTPVSGKVIKKPRA